LRTPAHFERAVGSAVNVRTLPMWRGSAASTASWSSPTDDGITVRQDDGVERRLRYDEIERARTVFEWGPTPRPAKPAPRRRRWRSELQLGHEGSRAHPRGREGISEDALLHVLADALASAYKRRPGAADEVEVELDPTRWRSGSPPTTSTRGQLGQPARRHPDRDALGRIAAQTFRQVMNQRIREAERERKFEEYAGREGDIVTGIIQQSDSRYTLLDLGKVEALLPQAEQVPYESPSPTPVSRRTSSRSARRQGPPDRREPHPPGPHQAALRARGARDRRRRGRDQACAREPGHRTKIAVWSNDQNVDPVGACVGARGRLASAWW
jgi:hypothetical protein